MDINLAVAQIIQLATGQAPTFAQQQAWTSYVNSGGSLESVVQAFVESTAFANYYNNGVPVDPNSPITPSLAQGIIEHTLPTYTPGQVDAWAATGLSVAAVFQDFALGDQYTALMVSEATGGGVDTVVVTDAKPTELVEIVGIAPITPPIV